MGKGSEMAGSAATSMAVEESFNAEVPFLLGVGDAGMDGKARSEQGGRQHTERRIAR